MNNPAHISESLETLFGVKILKFFYWDPGWKNFGPATLFFLKIHFLTLRTCHLSFPALVKSRDIETIALIYIGTITDMKVVKKFTVGYLEKRFKFRALKSLQLV